MKGEAVNTLFGYRSMPYILRSSYCGCRPSKTFFVTRCAKLPVVLLACVILRKLYCLDDPWTEKRARVKLLFLGVFLPGLLSLRAVASLVLLLPTVYFTH